MDGSIFISYRRGADCGFAGRLYDRLEHSFGRQRVFMDVDSIAPGEDFVAVLESRVAECDLLLALIGRGWLTATDMAGHRRLDNPNDFVRIEIAAALAQGKRVIPVVIDEVSMPPAAELPEALRPLARRNAIQIRHDRFRDDAEHLVRALEIALPDTGAERQTEEDANREVDEATGQRPELQAKRRAQQQERQESEEEAKRAAVKESPKPKLPLRLFALGAFVAVVLVAVLGIIVREQASEMEAALEKPETETTAENLALNQPPVSANAPPTLTEGYLYPFTATKRLSAADLAHYKKEELRAMRNEIYARYGYEFQSNDLRALFSNMPWYRPRTTDAEDVFQAMSDVERANVLIIRELERHP
ncbi:MAG: YARHG domain-containing protein [Nitrospira sp.]